MTERERDALVDVVKAMSMEELEVLADFIPIDLVLKRLEREIKEKDILMKRARAFRKAAESIDSDRMSFA